MKLSDWHPSKRMISITIGDLQKEHFKNHLINSDSPYEILLILIGNALGKEKTWVLAHPETIIDKKLAQNIKNDWGRFCKGTPLPYITGKQAFFGLDFQVNPSVLIPRPETELLVEMAIKWLKVHPECRKAVDVGTGSGIIAICLAKSSSDLQVIATDISSEALMTARQNARQHHVESNISFIKTNLLENIQQKFDVICANLPYVPTAKLDTINSIQHEPVLALDGGDNGLVLIERLIEQLPSRLSTPGLALLEIEETLGEAISVIARNTFPDDRIEIINDLAGKDRLLSITLE